MKGLKGKRIGKPTLKFVVYDKVGGEILAEKKKELKALKKEFGTTWDEAKDKIETLRDEKLFLIQEKSELAGSLKQLQKNMVLDQ